MRMSDCLCCRVGRECAVFDALPINMAVLDTTGNIVRVTSDWSRFAARLLVASSQAGYPIGVGSNYLEFLVAGLGAASEHAAAARKGILAVLLGRQTCFTLEHPGNEASGLHWFELTVSRLPDGGGVIVVHADITERKAAELSQRRSELRLQLALEAIGDGLWDWDVSRGVAYLSTGYQALTGLGPGVVVIDNAFFQQLIFVDDRSAVLQQINAHLRGETATLDVQFRSLGSGETRWLRGRGRVVERDSQDAPLRMIGHITDISERKRNEQRLLALLDENSRLGRELIRVQENERSELAREIHDELSQQLTAIRAYAGAIRRNEAGADERTRANAGAIEHSASQVYTVSHRIMEGLHPQILNIVGLVQALQTLISGYAECQPSIRFSFRFAGESEADDRGVRLHVFRIAQECLANLVRHSQARRARVFLGERHRQGRRWLRLVVRDDGVGMSTDVPRPGYGLVVVRERARMLNGRCTVDGHHGRGVRVDVEVPIGEE